MQLLQDALNRARQTLSRKLNAMLVPAQKLVYEPAHAHAKATMAAADAVCASAQDKEGKGLGFAPLRCAAHAPRCSGHHSWELAAACLHAAALKPSSSMPRVLATRFRGGFHSIFPL